jgi:[ribosomal protein S5]-alanine N-acetyltransferase
MFGPTLVGPRVTLGPIKPEHLENYCRWFADPQVTCFLTRDTPPTLKEEEEWLEQTGRSEHEIIWGLFVEGTHVGSTGISRIDWRNRRGATGILIGDRSFWGRGVAGESHGLRTRYAFEELGLEKLVTQVIEGNVASKRALQRVGYQTVGVYRHHEFRRGQWWGTWVAELLKEDWLRQQSGTS